MKSNRDSNIEILRIVLMTMILLSHLITHGKYEFPDNSVILSVQDAGILTFTRYHVNTFILISGFFGVSLNFRKIFGFSVMIFSWAFVGAVLDFVVFKHEALTQIVASLLNPFMSGWFVIQYFALMLYGPLINKGLEELSTKQFSVILVIYLLYVYGVTPSIISSASPHTFEFVGMYLIGRYIKRIWPTICKIKTTTIVCLNMLGGALFVMVVLSRTNSELYNRLLSNQDPIVILMGVFLLLLVQRIQIGSVPALNRISSCVIAAYLITDCTMTGRMMDKLIYNFSCDNALILIFVSFALVVFFSILESCRKVVFKKLEDKLYNKLIEHITV